MMTIMGGRGTLAPRAQAVVRLTQAAGARLGIRMRAEVLVILAALVLVATGVTAP